MEPRVLIVAEHASARLGGEAALPLHYFRVLRQRNIAAWLLTHERTRRELESLFPADRNRITFVPDTAAHRLLWRASRWLPARLSSFTTGYAMRFTTQLSQRRVMRRLIRDLRINVIHQPMPVSPKEPSLIYGMDVPVVIGPMNGGMDYPPAFRHMQGPVERLALAAGRRLAGTMNRLIPGKREAAMLLVANQRTREALPEGVCGRIAMLAENGVDLALWRSLRPVVKGPPPAATRFTFMGRLVDWKAVDLLLHAFGRAEQAAPMQLSIIGDGVDRPALERLAQELGLRGKVHFCGWISQAECAGELKKCDALVLSSLMECGGAVVLEAMAMQVPVIATAWGGPTDYLDASCGVLVEPASREALIEELAAALVRLARSPQERSAMGRAAQTRVMRHFDWEVKADRILEIYREVLAASRYGRT